MGKRISINLSNLLDNDDIVVTLLMEGGDAGRSVAQVEFKSDAMASAPRGLSPVGPGVFTLDVEPFQGRITLAGDFNLRGESWWPLMCHLHNNSIPYSVC